MNPLSPCPEPELLELFLKGELDQARADELRLHLASCGLCTLLAERIEAFHALAVSPQLPASADWDRLQPDIDERFRQTIRAAQPAAPPSRKNLGFWLTRPAVAWCCTFVLAFTTWFGFTRPVTNSISPPPAPLRAVSAQFLDLNATRNGHTAPSAPFTLRPGSPVVLGFFAAIQPGQSYIAGLTNQSGEVIFRNVPILPNDALGNFFVECDQSLLRPGGYLLTLSSTGALAPPRRFEFTIR